MPNKASLNDRIKAFNTGTMNVSKKMLTKKELEDKKKREQEQETAKVFEDFVASFDEKNAPSKADFVRGTIISADASGIKEVKNEKEGSAYQLRPPKRHVSKSSAQQSRKNLEEIKREIEKRMANDSGRKRKEETKRKSNLEAFKEELKQIHEAREEHVKIKQQIQTIEEKMKHRGGGSSSLTAQEQKILSLKSQIAATEEMANTDVTDPNSTNLYCSNIHSDLLEEHLCKLFGRYGPLASVKIMYPRSDEEKSISSRRNTNCGFVAFMCRQDAENALRNLNGIEYKSVTMSVTWGRVVPIPPQPIYVPKRLRKMLMPPPPTKQPFNALHPDMRQLHSVKDDPDARALWEKNLEESCVKVCVPTDRNLLHLIHRMVEFVVREGPMFEALIMNRELNNPMFRFLFDNPSPAHLYYRWKLFSVLQGDELHKWRSDPFRMFVGGSLWKPPPVNVYFQGMPVDEETDDEDDSGMMNSGLFIKPTDVRRSARSPSPDFDGVVGYRGGSSRSRYDSRARTHHDYDSNNRGESSRSNRNNGSRSPKRGFLSDNNKEKLDEIMSELTCSRDKIGEAMVFCLTNAECAEQIVRIIVKTMQHSNQHFKRLAFLYLVNDLLHNSSAKVSNAASYRRHIEPNLNRIFDNLHASYSSLEGKFKQEQFKQKVMNCFRAWEQWTVYPEFLLIKLQNIFLGLEKYLSLENLPDDEDSGDEADQKGSRGQFGVAESLIGSNGGSFGGALESSGHDLDGIPLTGGADEDLDLDDLQKSEDLDGIPLSKDEDHVARSNDSSPAAAGTNDTNTDLDGEPLQDAEASVAAASSKKDKNGSKWQQIGVERPATEGVALSKWEKLDEESDVEEEEKSPKGGEKQQKSSSVAALSSNAKQSSNEDDIDGVPMMEDSNSSADSQSGSSRPNDRHRSGGSSSNKPSKTVTNNKSSSSTLTSASQILDQIKLSESDKRRKLREIEVKVMKYQDELESGKKTRKSGLTLQDALQEYRIKLANKEREKYGGGKEDVVYESLSSGEEFDNSHHSAISSSHKSSSKKSRKRASGGATARSRSRSSKSSESQESREVGGSGRSSISRDVDEEMIAIGGGVSKKSKKSKSSKSKSDRRKRRTSTDSPSPSRKAKRSRSSSGGSDKSPATSSVVVHKSGGSSSGKHSKKSKRS